MTAASDDQTPFRQQRPSLDGTEPDRVHVVRVAYEDRYPPGTDLHDAVYEDLRRYCAIMGLAYHYRDVWFFSGMRWESVPGTGYCLCTGVRGVRASVEATVLPPDEAARRRRAQLTRPRPIPPGTARRRHWNDAINGTTRRQRRRLRRRRRKHRPSRCGRHTAHA
jgi:hypothetical protein